MPGKQVHPRLPEDIIRQLNKLGISPRDAIIQYLTFYEKFGNIVVKLPDLNNKIDQLDQRLNNIAILLKQIEFYLRGSEEFTKKLVYGWKEAEQEHKSNISELESIKEELYNLLLKIKDIFEEMNELKPIYKFLFLKFREIQIMAGKFLKDENATKKEVVSYLDKVSREIRSFLREYNRTLWDNVVKEVLNEEEKEKEEGKEVVEVIEV